MTKIAKFAILPASAFLVLMLLFYLQPTANDWPTRLHDIRRSGVTPEQLKLPLVKVWTYTSDTPSPAWSESPPIHDYEHEWYNLKPRQNFDRCFDVAVVGNLVYFGSSTSGAVTCINTFRTTHRRRQGLCRQRRRLRLLPQCYQWLAYLEPAGRTNA